MKNIKFFKDWTKIYLQIVYRPIRIEGVNKSDNTSCNRALVWLFYLYMYKKHFDFFQFKNYDN